MSGLIGLSQLILNNRNRHRRCSYCQMIGHNRRSCAFRASSSINSQTITQLHQESQIHYETDFFYVGNPDEQKECPICLNEFEKTNVFIPKCGHKLCGDCFFRNICSNRQSGRNCPICRKTTIPSNIFFTINISSS